MLARLARELPGGFAVIDIGGGATIVFGEGVDIPAVEVTIIAICAWATVAVNDAVIYCLRWFRYYKLFLHVGEGTVNLVGDCSAADVVHFCCC